MFQILMIEDAKDCQLLVKETLAKFANVTIAPTLSEAGSAIARARYDLIILDLGLPDGDGMEFFSGIAGTPGQGDTPVIFLTSKAESSTQVAAFSLGADDFIVKPIRPIEFRARVEAKLKRIAGQRSAETTLTRGELRIELGPQRASIVEGGSGAPGADRRELELTGREFKLLYHLARNEGTVFSRDQLITAVWGTGVHVLDRTVDTHIYTLRKKLGAHSTYIESEVGQGYRLNSVRPKKAKTAA